MGSMHKQVRHCSHLTVLLLSEFVTDLVNVTGRTVLEHPGPDCFAGFSGNILEVQEMKMET